jgi:hypothetical protein
MSTNWLIIALRYGILPAIMSLARVFFASHLWWPVLMVLVVVVIFAIVVAWIGRSELKKILRRLSKIGEILWSIWCFLFIIRWKFQFATRNFFIGTTLGALAFASFYLVIEMGITVVHGLGVTWQRPGGCYGAIFDLPALPLWFEAVLLFFAVLLFKHHLHEANLSRKQWELSPALERLLVKLDEFLKTEQNPSKLKKKAFLRVAMTAIKDVLEGKDKKRGLAISLLEIPEEGGQKLVITFVHPEEDSGVDDTLELNVGEGGGGKAYKDKAPIYIPSVRHLIGINVATKESDDDVTFKKANKEEPFRSILCVPVMVKGEPIAVLTFSSLKRSAFQPEDFGIASLAATFVAMFY